MNSITNYKLIELGTIENIRADKICAIDKDNLIVATYQNIKVFSNNKVSRDYDLKGYVPDEIKWDKYTIYSGNIVIDSKTDLIKELDFKCVSFVSTDTALQDLTLNNYEIKQTSWSNNFKNITVLLNYRSPRNKIVEGEIPNSILMKLKRDKSDNLKLIWHTEYPNTIQRFFQFDKELFVINGSIEKISSEEIATEIGTKEWNIRNLMKSENNTINAYSNKNKLYEINLDNLESNESEVEFPNAIYIEKYKNQYHLIADNQNQLYLFNTSTKESQELGKFKDKILSISSNSENIAIGFLAPIPYIKIFSLKST